MRSVPSLPPLSSLAEASFHLPPFCHSSVTVFPAASHSFLLSEEGYLQLTGQSSLYGFAWEMSDVQARWRSSHHQHFLLCAGAFFFLNDARAGSCHKTVISRRCIDESRDRHVLLFQISGNINPSVECVLFFLSVLMVCSTF